MPHACRRGIALVYALLIGLVLVAFLSALLVRVTQSLRFASYDLDLIRARKLADAGARVTVALMRDHDVDWYADSLPIRSTELGPAFTEEELGGGTFEVRIHDGIPGDPAPPPGTYRTVESLGRCRGRSARTVTIVKVTSPLLNYLFTSHGDMILGNQWPNPANSRVLHGPVFARSNPDTGQAGNVQFVHAMQILQPGDVYEFYTGTSSFRGEIEAAGGVFVRNLASPPGITAFTQPELPLQEDAELPAAQFFSHQDFTPRRYVPSPTWGGVTLETGTSIDSEVEADLSMPSMGELLKSLRDRPGKVEVNVDRPVLLEFAGSSAYLSELATRPVGDVYDRGVYRGQSADVLPHAATYGAGANEQLLREIAWDDPSFPQKNLPPDLRDLVGSGRLPGQDGSVDDDLDGDGSTDQDTDGDGIPEGDYFPLIRYVRGPTLRTISLSRSDWTVIYLRTSTFAATPTGEQAGPPVLMRGDVTGKAVVVYDVADDSMDPSCNRLHLFVLAQHEHRTDSAVRLAPRGAPGIPGGIRYGDRRLKTSAEDASATSEDGLVVVCRGSIDSVGQSGFWTHLVHDAAGNPVDYQAQLTSDEAAISSYYSGTPTDPDYLLTDVVTDVTHQVPKAMAYGMYIANQICSGARMDATGRLVVGSDPFQTPPLRAPLYPPNPWLRWAQFPPDSDPVGTGTEVAALPDLHRCAHSLPANIFHVKGSMHALGARLDLGSLGLGPERSWYDYRFREIEADEIKEMGLPLTVIPVATGRP
ncbi:MAG: hypothetical protein HY319_30185 [Armatimonadetes bacterium]|nr:hypothetical protein [Armatimonadota bacterium]